MHSTFWQWTGMFIGVLALPLIGAGQNLIVNPSFEDSACNYVDNLGRDDYGLYPNWNACAVFEVWVNHECVNGDDISTNTRHTIPRNSFGFQRTKEGMSYITFTFLSYNFYGVYPPQPNYLIGHIRSALTANRSYLLRYFVSLTEDRRTGTNDDQGGYAAMTASGISNLDVFFTDVDYCINSYRRRELYDTSYRFGNKGKVSPQIKNPRNRILANPADWMEVTGTFRAEGGEDRFLVGIFDSKGALNYKKIDKQAQGGIIISYYMDDFSLKPLPGLDVPSDTLVICGDKPRQLYPFAADSLHHWHNGSRQDTFMAAETGLYTARLSNFDTTLTDSVMVYKLPELDLGPDTSLCPGETLTLEPNFPPHLSYTWHDGSTLPRKTIHEPGTYWLEVSLDSCTVRDTIRVEDAGVQVNLGPDTTLCEGENLALTVPEYLNARWSTEATGSAINVQTGGTYAVQVDNGLCTAQDAVKVQYQQPPDPHIPKDTTFCQGDTFQLAYQQDWTFHKNRQAVSKPITFSEPGNYSIRVSNQCGKEEETLVLKQEACPCLVYFPNAFTPNGDGLNENFGPTYDCRLSKFQLTLYNRWGEQVYESRHPEEGWSPGSGMPSGVYMWKAVYTGYVNGYEQQFTNSGTVQLMR